MLSMNRNSFADSRDYISKYGRLWVTKSPYSEEVDKYLRDNEEMIVSNCKTSFKTTINGIEVSIDSFSVVFITEKEVVDAARTVAKVLAEAFPESKSIDLENGKLFIVTKDDQEFTMNLDGEVVEDKRKNHPDIIFFPNKDNQYFDLFKKFQNARTSNRERIGRHRFFAIDKYLFVFGWGVELPYLTNIEKLLQQPDPIQKAISGYTTCPIKGDKVSMKLMGSAEAHSIGRMELYSPPTVPKNAYLISAEPKFIQFTKSGILITNGVFFAREQLEEVNSRNYIVEKTSNGWEIYVHFSSDYDGHYKIQDKKLVLDPAHPSVAEKATDKNLVFIKNTYRFIREEGDKFIFDGTSVPKSKIYDRIKAIDGRKVVYIPRKVFESFLFGY